MNPFVLGQILSSSSSRLGLRVERMQKGGAHKCVQIGRRVETRGAEGREQGQGAGRGDSETSSWRLKKRKEYSMKNSL